MACLRKSLAIVIPRFTSKFWRALMERLGVSQAMSSAFHPETDGNTERVNRVLEDMLRHYVDPTQANWDSLLPLVEFAINDSVRESVRSTPFVLNYGKRPQLPADLVLRGRSHLALHLNLLTIRLITSQNVFTASCPTRRSALSRHSSGRKLTGISSGVTLHSPLALRYC
jgi:hypothetical protein